MPFKEIESTDNKIVKHITKLKNKKYRDEFGQFIVEGLRSVQDALDNAQNIEYMVISRSFYQSDKMRKLSLELYHVLVVPDKIFKSLSDTETPQGILCVVKIPKPSLEALKSYYIYCDNVQDPGNIGTIIRSADAFGFDGVMLSQGCTDVFNSKTIRSTMGSIFHIDIHQNCTTDTIKALKLKGYQLIVSALADDSTGLYDMVCSDKMILVVGNEGNGVSNEVLDLADITIKIPMYGRAESLNVSVAASLLMNEVARKRVAYEK